jgi:hypothetical protein
MSKLFLTLFGIVALQYVAFGQATINMGASGQPTVTNSLNGTLYDDGGPGGLYMNGANPANYRLLIQVPGADSIKITFTSYATELDWDYLRVYQGTNTSGLHLTNGSIPPASLGVNYAGFGPGLHGTLSAPFSYTAVGNSMYLTFGSDASVNGTGWVATWEAYAPRGYNNTGVVSIDSPATASCAGSYPVYATIKNFGLNPVTSFNIYWTVNGSIQTPYVFSGFLDSNATTQVNLGNYSFPVGTNRVIRAWTNLPNNVVDTLPNNDSASKSIAAALNGNYTIGGVSPDFANFTAAANALNTFGVCGPTTFTVAAGTYNEQVTIGPIPGISATNTVTINGVNRNNRIIDFTSTNTNAKHTIRLLNTEFVTIKNLTIRGNGNTAANFAFPLHISGATARNILIDSCNVTVAGDYAATTISTNFNPIVISSGPNYYDQIKADSITISNCTTLRGYFAICAYGITSGALSQNIKLINNNILDYQYYGAYLYYMIQAQVIGNTITAGSLAPPQMAVYMVGNGTNGIYPTQINNNIVSRIGVYGIYMSNISNPVGRKGLISNNIIHTQLTSTGYGIFSSTGNRFMYQHNSINMDASGSTGINQAAMYLSGGTQNSIMNNNLARTAPGLGAALWVSAASVVDTQNYNNYFKVDTAGLIYVGVAYNPSTFRFVGGRDSNSYNQNPSFVSPTNLRVTSGCLIGTPWTLANTPNDAFGNVRLTPTVGVHEFIRKGDDLAVEQVIAPTSPISIGSSDVIFRVRNVGNNAITSADFGYVLNGGTPVTQPWTGTLNACDTVTVTFTGSQQASLTNVSAFKMYSATPNFSIDSVPTNDTLAATFFSPLAGTYTIGGLGANFPTITQAVTVLTQAGIVDSVEFIINAGTYLEKINITGTIPGGNNATRPIKFTGVGRDSVFITTNAGSQAVFLINQQRYITLSGVTLTNNSPSGVGFAIVGTNTNNAGTGCGLLNSRISMPNYTTGTAYPIIVTASANGYGISAQRSDSITIIGNEFNGGYYGITVTGGSNALYNRYIRVNNNTGTNIYYMGAYINNNYNPIEFMYNNLNMNITYGYYGVYALNNQNSSTTVSHKYIGNKITNHGGYGFYITNHTTASATIAPTQIYNNMIVSGPTYNSIYGLYLASSSNGRSEVYHNTIVNRFPGTSTTYATFYYTGSTNLLVKNNIFANLAGVGTCAYFATNPTGNVVNYNLYYNPANANVLYRGAFLNTSNYKTATGGGDSSFYQAPLFASATDLHVIESCTPRGVDITANVPTDIDLLTRSTSPMVGADEIGSVANDLEVTALIAPTIPIDTGAQDVVLLVKNVGNTLITSFNVSYKHNGGATKTMAYSGSGLAPCESDTFTFTGADQIYIVNGNNSIQTFTSSPNSSPDGNPLSDTISRVMGTPLSGTYVIGAAPSNYLTFTAAISDAVTRGVRGRVFFDVKPGDYQEQLTIPSILGASDTSSVTFRSQNGLRNSVTLTWNSSVANTPVIDFVGNYVNFKNMTIRQMATAVTSFVIRLGSTASYDTLENCLIAQLGQLAAPSNYGYHVYATGYSGTGVTFKNNTIRGSYYGLYIFGNSTNRYRYLTFDNNIFDSAYYSQMYYLYYGRHTRITNNYIEHDVAKNASANTYMYWYYQDSDFVCRNNVFDMKGLSNGYLYNYYGIANPSNPAIVANNVMKVNGTGGMYWYDGNSVSNRIFAHNTLDMGNGYYYLGNSGLVNVRVLNNIFRSTQTIAYYITANPTSYTNLISDYNLIVSSSATPIYAGANKTITQMKQQSPKYEVNSVTYRAPFISNTNVMPNPMDTAVWLINGRGTHIASLIVPNDINNTPRATTVLQGAPDLGAYEVTPGVNVVAPLATATPATPVAGGTQSFVLGLDTVARITWDAFATAPATAGIRYYTGVTGNIQGVNGKYMYSYWDLSTTGTGSYIYDMNQYYKETLLGTVVSETDLRSAFRSGSTWVSNVSTGSFADSINNYLISPAMSMENGQFTGTDNNDPLVSFLTINTQPANQAKCIGDSALFIANATGTSITYQWEINTGSGFTTISGATNDSLTVNVTSVTQNGHIYRCAIGSLSGSANSNNATLTVNTPTTVSTQPANAAVCAGANVSFSIAATGSGLTYQWLENTGSGYSPIGGANSATLNRSGVSSGMNGYLYRCLVTGSCNSDTSNAASLTVTPLLSITTQPTSSIITCVGSNVSFNIVAVGVTNYQWQVEDGSGWANISGANSATLNLNSVTASMNGNQYRCALTGGCGLAVSTAGTLNVQTPGNWMGTTSSDWTVSTNWGCGQVPTASTNVVILSTASNMPVLAGTATVNNVTVQSGAALTLSTAASLLNINGNLVNNGTITNASGVIAFTGSSAQTINGGTYNKLRVNNAAGVSITSSLIVNDTLTFVAGRLTIGSNDLTLTNTGRIMGASATSYVVTNGTGSLIINNIGTGGRIGVIQFPVGVNATLYNPVNITNTGTADNFTVRALVGAYRDWVGSSPVVGSALTASAVNVSWVIDEAITGGSNATVEVQWNSSQELSGFNFLNCYVSRYNGIWNPGTTGAATGIDPKMRAISGVTAFSPFAVGSGSALPVEMVDFTAKAASSSAVLNWTTAAEVNNSHFVVQRSNDNVHFTPVTEVSSLASNGNSTRALTYSFVDDAAKANSANNTVYYRLVQVDMDGSEYTSASVAVNFTDAKANVVVAPNPFTHNFTVFAGEVGNHTVVVTDITGKVMFSKEVSNANSIQITEMNEMSAGIYFVTVDNGSAIKVLKQ